MWCTCYHAYRSLSVLQINYNLTLFLWLLSLLNARKKTTNHPILTPTPLPIVIVSSLNVMHVLYSYVFKVCTCICIQIMHYSSVCSLADRHQAAMVTKSPGPQCSHIVVSKPVRFSKLIRSDDCKIIKKWCPALETWNLSDYIWQPECLFCASIYLWSCCRGLTMEILIAPSKCMRCVHVAYSVCHSSMFMLTTCPTGHSILHAR